MTHIHLISTSSWYICCWSEVAISVKVKSCY